MNQHLKIIKQEYPDKSFYSKVITTEEQVSITFRINSYADLIQLMQIKDSLDNQKVLGRLTIPCLLDAQHDRRFNSNESHNLKLICKLINDMKWESVTIFHPHNQEVVEALIDNVKIIDNTDFIDTVLAHITESAYDTENYILLSPDAGAFKWIAKLADKLNWQGEVYSASKSRKYEDDKSILTQFIDRHDFGGKDILVIDDLCVNGGTFIGLAKLLRERNVGKLYLAVSHVTVEQPNRKLWEVFDKVFTTNSKGLTYCWYKDQGLGIPKNLEVIKLFKE